MCNNSNNFFFRKIIIGIIFILQTELVYSQFFKNGYFITNSGDKKECLIKYKDWKNNPTFIEYKFTEEGEVSISKIDDMTEFSVYGKPKFVRMTIDIDRLGGDDVKLCATRSETLINQETVFLKWIVVGKVNLYSYVDTSFLTFFYSFDGREITQLIVKKTEDERGYMNYFNQYKQQIKNILQCQEIKDEDIQNLEYGTEKFTAIFMKYNSCIK